MFGHRERFQIYQRPKLEKHSNKESDCRYALKKTRNIQVRRASDDVLM